MAGGQASQEVQPRLGLERFKKKAKGPAEKCVAKIGARDLSPGCIEEALFVDPCQ
jgi:hypothetical protein